MPLHRRQRDPLASFNIRGVYVGREAYESDAVEIGFTLGHVSAKFSPYAGLTDEEAAELKAELDAKQAKKLPLGFRLHHTETSTDLKDAFKGPDPRPEKKPKAAKPKKGKRG